MTLIEAVASGKAFGRPKWRKEGYPFISNDLPKGVVLDRDDILAKDYYVEK